MNLPDTGTKGILFGISIMIAGLAVSLIMPQLLGTLNAATGSGAVQQSLRFLVIGPIAGLILFLSDRQFPNALRSLCKE